MHDTRRGDSSKLNSAKKVYQTQPEPEAEWAAVRNSQHDAKRMCSVQALAD
jgi:hypothetical protein